MRALTKSDFRHVEDVVWEIPPTFRVDMRVPARLLEVLSISEQQLQRR